MIIKTLCCLHPVLLARALPAIMPQEITLEEFQAKSGIGSRTTAKDVLNFMNNYGIGAPTFRDRYIFTKADRMKLSLLALRKGCDIENISRSYYKLHWFVLDSSVDNHDSDYKKNRVNSYIIVVYFPN